MEIQFATSTPQPARRLAPESISQRFDTSRDLRARVGRIVAAAEAKLAAIDPRYTAAARAQEERRIKDGVQEDAAPLGAKLGEILAELEGQLDHYTAAAVRSRALHGDKGDDAASVQAGIYWLARLPAAPAWELVEVARKAASEYDLALALRVEAEIQRRGLDGDDAALALGLCASVPLPPQDLAAAGKIGAGITTCQLALTEIQEMVTGASRPESRLEIAFAASARSQAASPKGRQGAVTAATLHNSGASVIE